MTKYRLRIGLQTYGIDSEYNARIIDAMRRKCAEMDADLLLYLGTMSTSDVYSYQQFSVSEFITKQNVDVIISSTGTICTSSTYAQVLKQYPRMSEIPIICLSADIPGKTSIVVDNITGVKEIVTHLIEKHSCKTFAVISGVEHNIDSQERLSAVKEVLDQYHFELPPESIYNGTFHAEAGYSGMQYFAEHGILPVNAIICLNDDTAYGVIQYCNEHSIAIPGDVIVTGFDDIFQSSCTQPTLTTVHQDFTTLGNTAIEYAVKKLQKKRIPHLTVIDCPPVYRGSCGCVPNTSLNIDYLSAGSQLVQYRPMHFRLFGERYFALEREMSRFQLYIMELGKITSLDGISRSLEKALKHIDIRSAMFVLYKEPQLFTQESDCFIPSEVYIPLAYDETGVKNCSSIVFDPNEKLIPDSIFSNRQRTLEIRTIYYAEKQFGYIVYEAGSLSQKIYTVFPSDLSNTVNAAWLCEENKRSERKLSVAIQQLETHSMYLDTLSNTDEMTGLFNRRGFLTIGQQIVDLSLSLNKPGLVVFADMDGLKAINDTYGHHNGDIAIKAMASILKNLFRETDTIARMGGDEFAIIAVGQTSALLPELEQRLKNALVSWNATQNYPFVLSVSFGAWDITPQFSQLTDLLHEADSKLYKEKKRKHEKSKIISSITQVANDNSTSITN